MTEYSDRHTWDDEDTYWRANYRTRPYVSAGSSYDKYRPGYRYGYDAVQRYHERHWDDIEPDLAKSWDTYEHRGHSTWEQIKDAVRDAWERVTGRHTVGTR